MRVPRASLLPALAALLMGAGASGNEDPAAPAADAGSVRPGQEVAQSAPSGGLIEFLGSWDDERGDWLDPFELWGSDTPGRSERRDGWWSRDG